MRSSWRCEEERTASNLIEEKNLPIDHILENLDECPWRRVSRHLWLNEILNAWLHYEKGHLPYSGGFFDQPNVFVQAVEVINSEKALVDELRQKRAELKQKKQQGAKNGRFK